MKIAKHIKKVNDTLLEVSGDVFLACVCINIMLWFVLKSEN
jgi:hypothetical protein